MQLDLLTYTLTPEELQEPQPQPKAAPVNRHLIDYWEAGAAVYLRLMNRMMTSSHLPQHVKRHEISRLHEMRQEALARMEEIKNGCL